MHHYALVVTIRSSTVTQMDGWYIHGSQIAHWNKARPRTNICNNNGQTKLFVTEDIPWLGPDASWRPLVDYEEVCWYEKFDSSNWNGPETYL